MTSPTERQVAIARAEYYPPESEVGEHEIGIEAMSAMRFDVMHHVHDGGIVTLAAQGERANEVLSYEFDLSSAEARQLAWLLAVAANEADQP